MRSVGWSDMREGGVQGKLEARSGKCDIMFSYSLDI